MAPHASLEQTQSEAGFIASNRTRAPLRSFPDLWLSSFGGKGLLAIAEGLTRGGILCPCALDGQVEDLVVVSGGADPVIVAGWMSDEQGRKAELERRFTHLPVGCTRTFDRKAMAASLRRMGDMAAVLGSADPARKAKIYAEMGLELTFDPAKHEVLVAVTSNQDTYWVRESVRGGTRINYTSI